MLAQCHALSHEPRPCARLAEMRVDGTAPIGIEPPPFLRILRE